MSNRYSDLISAVDATTAEAGLTTGNSGYLGPMGRGGSPMKTRHARMDFRGVPVGAMSAANFQDNDVWAMVPILSSDLIYGVHLTVDALFAQVTTLTIDVGLYNTNALGQIGAVIDLDLFASLVDIDSTAVARVDVFGEATTLVNLDRGKPAWVLAAIGAAGYTVDPNEQWYISIQVNAVGNITTAGQLMLEVDYKDD